MQAPNFVSLGSICTVQGSEKKLMVVARGLVVRQDDGKQRYYDYGACLYPEGLIGEVMLYFNHDSIAEVVFQGFIDQSEEEMRAKLKAGV
ncbi:MAG: DUF4176 domain-containing protein, partial [Coriobacteriales bacterium]|nr:DUF4176 domain-containing protein [Coriobacteriales bacterium]